MGALQERNFRLLFYPLTWAMCSAARRRPRWCSWLLAVSVSCFLALPSLAFAAALPIPVGAVPGSITCSGPPA
jgi:hypothetical protein